MVNQVEVVSNRSELDTIDRATLTLLVRRSLDSETAEIIDWSYSQVYGGAGDLGGVLSGIFRFSGNGLDQGKVIPWSLILKILGSGTTDDDPSEPRYWKREVFAYQSGQLDYLPGDMVAPRCFDIFERSEQEVWLWLEDITDEIGPRWPLEHYGLIARHLGQFNGAYLYGEPLPTDSWLSQGWLRAMVNRAEPGVTQLRGSLDHPLMRRVYPDDQANRTFALWAERETYLDALDRLPQTFCHRDAFRRNLFARYKADGSEQTVAIDWTFAGIGAIGEEINPLVNGTIDFSEVEPSEIKALDDIVFNGYLKGLEDAGWRDDPRLVRFAFAASSALCFNIAYGLGDALCLILDEDLHPWTEQTFGQPMEAFADLWANNDQYRLNLADEARILLGQLDELKS